MPQQAPIAFFAYKRPEHTRRALESLAQNQGAEESELFIFCEGAKQSKDEEGVRQVRELVRSRQWCGRVHIVEREKNLGCANSIMSGVTEVCEKHGRVIVVEDDLVLSPFFLDYMNQSLDLYADNHQVMEISGYMFPFSLDTAKETVFLTLPSAWGWATWQRAWQQFDPDMSAYSQLKASKAMRYRFDINDSYYFFSMLEAQLKGKIDAWDIRWYLSMFMQGGLVLCPIHSLVSNIGFDGSGTHYVSQSSVSNAAPVEPYHKKIKVLPELAVEDVEATHRLADYFKAKRLEESSDARKFLASVSSWFRGTKRSS